MPWRDACSEMVGRLSLSALLALTCLTHGAGAQQEAVIEDSFFMGAGVWTCGEVLAAREAKDVSRNAQAAGWILGAWSMATTQREKGFTDIVEKVGGAGLFELTLKQCATAPETQLYRVVYSMIANTNPGRE